jgi:hypothetical protein
MKTRDLVLVGAGLVVGYLLVGYLNKSKDNAQELTGANVDQEKIKSCNEEVDNLMMTVKLKEGTDLEKFKKDAFDSCMAKNA